MFVASFLPAIIAAVVAIVVVLLTSHLEAQRSDATALREVRSETYSAYLATLNEYASHQQSRKQECIPESNEPIRENEICSTSIENLQTARFAYQGAVNDMYIYGSDAALVLVNDIASLLPVATSVSGLPAEGGVSNIQQFSTLFRDFIQLMREDAAPTRP